MDTRTYLGVSRCVEEKHTQQRTVQRQYVLGLLNQALQGRPKSLRDGELAEDCRSTSFFQRDVVEDKRADGAKGQVD